MGEYMIVELLDTGSRKIRFAGRVVKMAAILTGGDSLELGIRGVVDGVWLIRLHMMGKHWLDLE